MNHVFTSCVSRQYPNRMPISHGKYINGKACILKAGARGENGINIPMAMISEVSATTGAEAQL